MEDTKETIEMIKETRKSIEYIFTEKTDILWKVAIIVIPNIFLYSIIIKMSQKYDHKKILEKKIEKALKKDHVIVAKLKKQSYSKQSNITERRYKAVYEYTIDNKVYTYKTKFKTGFPPEILHLYYEKNPRKLFKKEENEQKFFMEIFMTLVQILPLIITLKLVKIFGIVG